MTVTLRNVADVNEVEHLKTFDPFQLAPPVWLGYTAALLPPVVVVNYAEQRRIQTLLDKEKIQAMAIRIIKETEAPIQMFKRGIVSSKQDYLDVMNALPKMAQGQALVVDMTPKDWEGVKKPETTFGSSLRRSFEAKGLSVTAYQSGPMQVTVKKTAGTKAKK
jgi:hypothetical protein